MATAGLNGTLLRQSKAVMLLVVVLHAVIVRVVVLQIVRSRSGIVNLFLHSLLILTQCFSMCA